MRLLHVAALALLLGRGAGLRLQEAVSFDEAVKPSRTEGAALPPTGSVLIESILMQSAQQAGGASKATRAEPDAAPAAAPAEGANLWNMLTAPDSLIAILFAVLCTLAFMNTMFSDVITAKKREEVRAKHVSLYTTFGIEAGRLMEHLEIMVGDTTTLAERNFQDKQRSMQKSLTDLMKDKNPLLSEPKTTLAQVYRRWFLCWLRTFGQCSLDPVHAPKHIASEAELKTAGSVKAMAELLLNRLKAAPVSFITEDLQNASQMLEGPAVGKKGRQRTFRSAFCCCGGCCCSWITCACGFGVSRRKDATDQDPYPMDVKLGLLKITLLSASHIRTISGVFIGLALGVYYGVVQQFILAGVAGYGTFLLLILLCYVDGIDERQRLEREVKELEQRGKEIDKRRTDINTSYGKMQNLMNLWRHQTVPRLENYSELDLLIKDVPDDRKFELLDGLVGRMERLDAGMGSLSMWIGDTALEEKKLELFAKQMDVCTSALSKQHSDINPAAAAFRRLDNFCGFLTVRIIACYDLPNKDGGMFFGSVDAYVVVLAEESTQSFRTRGVENDLNPRFSPKKGPYSEQFFMPVSAESQRFNLQVWGDNGTEEPTRFGFLMTKFRDKPGNWQRRREKLYNMRTRKLRDHGEIEYEYFFASSVDSMKTMLAN